MKTNIISFVLLLSGSLISEAQGFLNLDFEQGYTVSNNVLTIPDWIASAPYVTYDDPSLSGNSISICDTNAFSYTIQGKYFMLMASGNEPGSGVLISLGQTGTIPLGSESVTFWGNIGGLQITFADRSLAFSEISSTANYNVYGANISQFAGATGQLLFSLPPYVGNATLDNIQFSTSPIPEPNILCLGACAGAAFGWRRWRKWK